MKQLTVPKSLKVGEYYTNDQIHYALEVANLGGIRPKINKKSLDFIVLITSAEENRKVIRNPYADRIEGDVLIYTGAGLKGDQQISGVNKRILEQFSNPIPILGFIKEAPNKYKFIGFLFLLRYYQDNQLDNNEELRKAWIFEFQIYSDIPILEVGKFNHPFNPFYEKFKSEVLPEDTIINDLINLEKNDNNKIASITNEDLKDIETLKSQLLTINPYEFEGLMGKLIEHTGFQNVKVTKKSGDDGIDLNAILKHKFSLDISYQFQVKRWKHSVGRKEVANLRGSLGFNSFGVIISTSHFTTSAFSESGAIGKTPVNLVGIKQLYQIIKETNFVLQN